MLFITGGAGFIGSNFILEHLQQASHDAVVNVDALTYAGNHYNLASVASHSDYQLVHANIIDEEKMKELMMTHQPRAIIHFAAESHVDRSISSPTAFVQTNVNGTCTLLNAALFYWKTLDKTKQQAFRFIHISTDEVYGTLGPHDRSFTEHSHYAPNSPYSASKAASDHFVRAYYQTYGLPVIITHCANNYGPYQFPEKLIPLMILNALNQKPLPLYGDGLQVRDWLHVSDHCAAIRAILHQGKAGEVYNIGGNNEYTNLQIVSILCDVLDRLSPKASGSYHDQITHVADRPGHDRRYAINAAKIQKQFGWQPKESLHSGLAKTVEWYLHNSDWIEKVRSQEYQHWMDKQYQLS